MASKIIYVIVAMVMLNVSAFLFTCSGGWDPTTGECAGSLIASDSSDINSTIWDLALNPQEVGTGFWDKLFGSGWGLMAAIGLVSIGTLLVGTTVFGKNIETTIFIAIGIGLASVTYPAIKLHQTLASWGDATSLGPVGGFLISVAVASTIVITVVFTVLDWSRGRD